MYIVRIGCIDGPHVSFINLGAIFDLTCASHVQYSLTYHIIIRYKVQ